MKFLTCLLSALSAALFLSSCATSRSPFTPQGPPTVGMPSALSERERLFVPELETVLKNQGYTLVRHGAGDMQLEFKMAAGPVNTDTTIELYEGKRLLAKGTGRGSGAPLIGRSKVAERSFSRAFEEFQTSLAASTRKNSYSSDPVGAEAEYVY